MRKLSILLLLVIIFILPACSAGISTTRVTIQPPVTTTTITVTAPKTTELSISETKLTVSGILIAVSGDTIVVRNSAVENPVKPEDWEISSVEVLVRDGSTWTEQARIHPKDSFIGDRFGWSVDIDGDTIVAGSNLYRFATRDFWPDKQPSAYVFTRNGSTWTEQAKLTASDADAGGNFGHTVAISGDTIVVGAFVGGLSAASEENKRGSIYVFVRNGSTWTEQAKLTASDWQIGDSFGHFIDIDGDTIVVGSGTTDTDAGESAGAAYIYSRNGSTWTEQAKLTASDADAGDRFGEPVSISGDTIVLGSERKDIDTLEDAGAAYVFTRDGSTWTEQAKLTASDADEFDRFGQSVAIDTDVIVVGSYYDDTLWVDSGSAYVFARDGSTWTEQIKLIASDGCTEAWFGVRAAICDNTVVVSAYATEERSINTTSVYIYKIP